MEIFIIGIIIVGLMVYVSTKIKKVAKTAYEREIFDGGKFTIIKPEGFLIPLNENSPFVFEARSKEFGDDEARDFYKCLAIVTEKNGTDKNESTEIETAEKNVALKVFRKSLADLQNDKTYELEIKVLPDYTEEFAEKINEMRDSFQLKNL